MRRIIKTLFTVIILGGLLLASSLLFNQRGKLQTENTPTPAQTILPEPTHSEIPTATETPTATPQPGNELPDHKLTIRTDYEIFTPNEAGEIPIIMFHRFIEAYEPNTEKEYTTTFGEFEALLQTLYDQGFRLISMKDFIDGNVSVPAGTMPMVFTFDDGTAGQFNLINENGIYKVNPKSAVGIMMAFNEEHPDFGLKGIFYVNMDIGDNTFKGEGTLQDRFEYLKSSGFELGSHTWGHVDYSKIKSVEKIQESLGKNEKKVKEILPETSFYSLALPYGIRPDDKTHWKYLEDGSYNESVYHHDTIMAVGAAPSVPAYSRKYNSLYVLRVRAQGRVAVDADLTWWLPKMTSKRMFISDGDPKTIVIPQDKIESIDQEALNGKKLISY